MHAFLPECGFFFIRMEWRFTGPHVLRMYCVHGFHKFLLPVAVKDFCFSLNQNDQSCLLDSICPWRSDSCLFETKLLQSWTYYH